ncbi:unnamed protein product [Trichobilharzia regenti]|nr:unnamed protein product [Trichobilharzia regenti]
MCINELSCETLQVYLYFGVILEFISVNKWRRQILKRCIPLEMFWRRFNKVQLDRLAIAKEHNMLEQENLQLKLLLKQYLDGISISNEVVTGDNSLLVINGRSNVSIANDPRIKMIPTGENTNDGNDSKEIINYATTPTTVDYRVKQTI